MITEKKNAFTRQGEQALPQPNSQPGEGSVFLQPAQIDCFGTAGACTKGPANFCGSLGPKAVRWQALHLVNVPRGTSGQTPPSHTAKKTLPSHAAACGDLCPASTAGSLTLRRRPAGAGRRTNPGGRVTVYLVMHGARPADRLSQVAGGNSRPTHNLPRGFSRGPQAP